MGLLFSLVQFVYLFDKDKYKIPAHLRWLYKEIFIRSYEEIGEPPSIFRGDDFNNKIKWLMLFDQGEDIVRCSDKLAVRGYVSDKIGDSYLNELYQVWDSADAISFETLPDAFVIKTNHDSGSVWIVKNKSTADLESITDKISRRLERTYGVGKGEWCYRHIRPRVFAEEYLPSDEGGPPDYKFHCASGQVVFLQFIFDRAKGRPKEQIVRRNGVPTDLRLDHEFRSGERFKKPDQWEEMIRVAEALSKPFKYVRVDLYLVESAIRFGELTFYPKNGNYKTEGQKLLGKWLDIDRSTTRTYDA
jgi:hypothetical protein